MGQEEMTLLAREDLLKFKARRYVEVAADWIEPGKRVRIQSITERERAELEKAVTDGDGSVRARVIVATVVDSAGNRIFTDDHVDMIDSLDSQITGALFDAISDHCDMGGDRLGKIEAHVKN
jgi:hypothetical protein